MDSTLAKRFTGTCYKAANWICVGQTLGRGKWDRKNAFEKPVKTIWLYPLQQRIKQRNLQEADYELLQGLAETVECLSQALAEKDTSIARLCKYLLGAPTETAKNVLKDHRQEPTEKQARKGHGKKAAADYSGAARVSIKHPCLKPGDPCPGCERASSTSWPCRRKSHRTATTAQNRACSTHPDVRCPQPQYIQGIRNHHG